MWSRPGWRGTATASRSPSGGAPCPPGDTAAVVPRPRARCARGSTPTTRSVSEGPGSEAGRPPDGAGAASRPSASPRRVLNGDSSGWRFPDARTRRHHGHQPPWASEGQCYLHGTDFDPTDFTYTGFNGLLAPLTPGTGITTPETFAIILTGTETGHLTVTLNLHPAPPPAPDDLSAWDDIVEAGLYLPDGDAFILDGHGTILFPLTPDPEHTRH